MKFYKRKFEMKNLKIILLWIALVCQCSSYANEPKPDLSNPEVVAELVKTEKDNFKKIIIKIGPFITMDGSSERKGWVGQPEMGHVQLVANKRELTNEDVYGLNIHINFWGGWRDYETAYDSNGYVFGVKKVNRYQEEGTKLRPMRTEVVMLGLTRKYLEDNQEKGIRFQVRNAGEKALKGSNGYVSVYFDGFLSEGYIKGFLSALN